MFLEILVAIFIGICLGTITGLIPGIHINLLAVIILSLAPSIGAGNLVLVVGIFAMSIVHTFLDIIPSVYLGAPDEAMAFNALPAHRMLLDGNGHYAVVSSLLGSYMSLFASIIFLPVVFLIVLIVNDYLKSYVPYFILLIVLYLIVKIPKKIHINLGIYLLASIIGVIVLKSNVQYYVTEPFYHIFTGFFGIAVLLLSSSNLPKQDLKKETTKIWFGSSILGVFGGILTGVIPGTTTSVSISIMQPLIQNMKKRQFIYFTSGINTSAMIISLYTFYLVGRMRNGIMITINELLEISFFHVFVLLLVGVVAGSIALIFGLKISEFICKMISKVKNVSVWFSYDRVRLYVAGILFLLSFVFDGFVGIIVVSTCTAIGIIAQKVNAQRTMLMGVLLTPLLMFYFL